MTRQRDFPSIQYRSPNMVTMTFPIVPGSSKFRVNGAARINDAYGNVAGVGGFGTLPMFEVLTGSTFRSQSVQSRRLPAVEESSTGLSRVIYDPDDYATPVTAAASYLPSDDNVAFLRLQRYNDASAAYLSEGPIMVLPPYDFFTTRGPIITLTGIAPNLNIGAFPANIADTLPPEVLNFLLPGYLSTISICNLDAALPLFFSLHPGMAPTVVRPTQEVSLNGGGSSEFFVACPNGNPWFTVRASVINSA